MATDEQASKSGRGAALIAAPSIAAVILVYHAVTARSGSRIALWVGAVVCLILVIVLAVCFIVRAYRSGRRERDSKTSEIVKQEVERAYDKGKREGYDEGRVAERAATRKYIE